jgi:hypothetical protein
MAPMIWPGLKLVAKAEVMEAEKALYGLQKWRYTEHKYSGNETS